MIRKYYEMGFSVIPVDGKRPVIKGWTKYCTTMPTDEEISEWEKKYPFPRYGIGLCCGSASGIMGLDDDSGDPELNRLLPPSPVIKEGRPGLETRFYRFNPALKLKHLDGLDILSTGSQMVLPPSIHPDTKKQYKWKTQDTLENFAAKDLPWITETDLRPIYEHCGKPLDNESNSASVELSGIFTHPDNSRCPHGSHNRLLAMTGKFIRERLSVEDAVRELLAYDSYHHRPVSYFADKTRPDFKGSPESSAKAFYTNILNAANKNRINRGEAPLMPLETRPPIVVFSDNPFSAKNYYHLGEIKLPVLEWKPGKRGPIPPSHNEVASALLHAYGNHLMREKDDVFLYVGTHWQELDAKDFKRFIRGRAQILMSNKAKDHELTAFYNVFLDKLDRVIGQSFYQQPPFLANFLDGTLEVVQVGDKYSPKFRQHQKPDLLTWVLPYRYTDPRPENPIFTDWLFRAFEGDPDANDKLRALRQIGGACLVSLFPRTVFFYGPAGTGKSTFAKLCMAFVGRNNVASVQPNMMKQGSFLMESLINKQVNIVTDISEDKIDPATFKQIEDRVPIQVNRKNRTAVNAFIPAVHIFCGNVLPQGVDGASNAMDRRVSIVEFNRSVGTETQSYSRDFEQAVLRAGVGAVLQFFLDGLTDLCESGGLYTNPESGRAALLEWKLENDPVGAFLHHIKSGEHPNIIVAGDASILASDLLDYFKAFSSKHPHLTNVHRNSFYKRVEQAGFKEDKDRHKVKVFRGLKKQLLIGS